MHLGQLIQSKGIIAMLQTSINSPIKSGLTGFINRCVGMVCTDAKTVASYYAERNLTQYNPDECSNAVMIIYNCFDSDLNSIKRLLIDRLALENEKSFPNVQLGEHFGKIMRLSGYNIKSKNTQHLIDQNFWITEQAKKYIEDFGETTDVEKFVD